MTTEKIQLKISLKNGAELQRLLELLIDAGVLTKADPLSEPFRAAKERLSQELGDLSWIKRLVHVE